MAINPNPREKLDQHKNKQTINLLTPRSWLLPTTLRKWLEKEDLELFITVTSMTLKWRWGCSLSHRLRATQNFKLRYISATNMYLYVNVCFIFVCIQLFTGKTSYKSSTYIETWLALSDAATKTTTWGLSMSTCLMETWGGIFQVHFFEFYDIYFFVFPQRQGKQSEEK